MSKKYILATLVLSTAVFFQNCSGVSFQDANEPKLISKAGTMLDNENQVTDGEDTTPTEPPTTELVDEELDPELVDNESDPEEPIVDDPVVEDSGELNFICVLNGPGKSHYLHLIEGGFENAVSTPKAVCTSRTACEDIVSQAFEVKEAKFKGACKNNPHVVRLTGEEISSLLGQ